LTARELAECLGMSPSTLWRRINELEQVGAIEGRVALLNPEKVGLPVCVFVFINMVNHDKQTLAEFVRFVNDTASIMECFAVTGTHDYTLIVRASSVGAFEKILMEQILPHASVASASSQIALRQHKYSTALPL
ncbi:MAG: winged helix-turn-helix transcriptional regulator, partial [Desulfobulbaceae bacterium]|nr:winged helix-turn-helix transcriptional regulator [Desulfobulbaceae bacterium]